MSIQDKYDAAQKLLCEHNDAVGINQPGFVDPEKFISCIKTSGGTTEDLLSRFSYEELLRCMPETDGIKPVALAKAIADIFRDKATKTLNRPASSKKAERMTSRELVECFDPEEFTSPVAKRLKEIVGKEKFIVYESGRIVDVETTLRIFIEVKQGFPGRDDIEVKGNIKRVFQIGELPQNYADENPLYYNRPLRPDGTCDQTGRSWEGVDKSIRQLIRVAVDEGQLKVNLDKAHDVLDIAVKPDALKLLLTRYKSAAVKFDELEEQGNLPRLQVPISKNKEARAGNPFNEGKKVQWFLPHNNANYYNRG